MSDYFPSKLAVGDSFCNRDQERAALLANIEHCRHAVLIAPRRHGKSSLALKVAEESSLPLAFIDLFLAHDNATVTARLLAGVSRLINILMPLEQKVLTKLAKLFDQFSISLTAAGFSLETTKSTTEDAADIILQALQGLDRLAKSQQKKVIVFIDEFQDIEVASSAKSIQGAIRHVAQMTEHVVFLFSGSNRRLLTSLFDDKAKPLYMLCDQFVIQRMTRESYTPHLQALAVKKWQAKMTDAALKKILRLTECHPYYVNFLCHRLWQFDTLPTPEIVVNVFEEIVQESKTRLVADLEKLTVKQKTVLKALAKRPTAEPTSQAFLSFAQISASTMKQAMQVLFDKDMIYVVHHVDDELGFEVPGEIRVLDPLLGAFLRSL